MEPNRAGAPSTVTDPVTTPVLGLAQPATKIATIKMVANLTAAGWPELAR
jgi:hypothetical protein